MIDIPKLEPDSQSKERRYIIWMNPERVDLMNIACIASIIKCLTQYSDIIKQIFPMYKAFKHSILISPPCSTYYFLYILIVYLH